MTSGRRHRDHVLEGRSEAERVLQRGAWGTAGGAPSAPSAPGGLSMKKRMVEGLPMMKISSLVLVLVPYTSCLDT